VSIYLIGAVGSPALGYQYVFYNEKNNEWFTYHNWGSPIVKDINSDGNKEVFMQFQGKGNNFPDINIIKWDSGWFQISRINDAFYKAMEIDLSVSRLSSTVEPQNAVLHVDFIGNGAEGSTDYSFETLEELKFIKGPLWKIR
jgi:hypothetical protein